MIEAEPHVCEITVFSTRDVFYQVFCRMSFCTWSVLHGPAPEPLFDIKLLKTEALQAEKDHMRVSHAA